MPSSRFQQRIIPKIDTLDPQSMQSVIQHLAREHGFLETVFNSIQEAVLVISSDLRIVYYNPAAKEILGLPDELSHLPVSKLMKGVNWESILPKQHEPASRVLRQQIEIAYPVRRILQFYAVPLDQCPDLFALILTDITATMRKAASHAENERSQMVSMLAAGVAHEIGNPLNSLYLHLQFLQRMLARPGFDPGDALEEVSESRAEVERLDSIINQFLKALRPGKPELQSIDLKELVLEALKFMHPELENRKIVLQFLWGESVPRIMGDAGQLKQALYNLVKNAIQSMPQSGRLEIVCRSDDDSVFLSVADNGCGIRKEDLSRIFKPYFTTKGASGNGLGLMIVERIIRDHGATLSVDSAEGRGTTFTMTFPRCDRLVKVLPPPQPVPVPPCLPSTSANF